MIIMFFWFLLPPILLMLYAQYQVKSAFAQAMRVPARVTGAVAARQILDSRGLADVPVVETPGHLSDHFDPRANEVRLSSEVYHSQTAASVGIAAHEVGHALQYAQSYSPLVLRNFAVPAAQFGGNAFTILLIVGLLLHSVQLILLGALLFGGVVLFQMINLPVEFDASHRARQILPELNIIDQEGAVAVNRVLNAAALTYVAATLQAIMTFLYYILQFSGRRD